MKRLTGILKGLILLVAMMLAAGLSNGYAQNTSANPYIDSWHRYQVNSDATANSVTWWLQSDETLSPVTRLDLSALDAGANWITIGTGVGTDYVDIKFVDAQFNSGQTWYLIFSEWDNTEANGRCVARRSMNIAIQENTFYLSLGEDTTMCNPLDGNVLNWANIDNEEVAAGLTLRITMNKAEGFAAKTWSFSGSISLTNGYNITGATSIVAHGSDIDGFTNDGHGYNITYNAVPKTFTVTVAGSSTGAGVGESDYVDILVMISGLVWKETEATLTITGGQATSGTNYPVITDDNGSGNKDRKYTLWALPATSNIVFNN